MPVLTPCKAGTRSIVEGRCICPLLGTNRVTISPHVCDGCDEPDSPNPKLRRILSYAERAKAKKPSKTPPDSRPAPDPETIRVRRAICASCEDRRANDGKCPYCRCGDPALKRPWCPAGKWGTEARAAAQAKHDEAAAAEVRSQPSQTVLIMTRPKNWQKVQDRVTAGLSGTSWRVESTPFVPEAEPDQGVAAWISAHGVTPRAAVSWEEHGCTFLRKSTLTYAQWCIERGIAPLHIDLANLDHGKAYIVDYYNPADGHGLIDEDWESVSDAPIDWDEYDPRLAAFIRAAQRRQDDALASPPIRPSGYVVLWTQWSTHLSRLPGTWPQIARRIAAEIAPRALVVKTGPIGASNTDDPAAWAGLDLLRHDKSDPLQNERLIRDAAYHIILSSSVSHQLILAGAPVHTIGRSRFTGKGVFHEITDYPQLAAVPLVNQPARNRWLRWWAENLSYPDQLAARIDQVCRRVVSPKTTTVTAVYVNDARSETITRECLAAVAREYPDAQRIAAVDKAPPAFVRETRAAGFEIVTVGPGEPPRLMPLYQAALSRAAADRILTVESDVILPDGFAAAMDKAAAKAFSDPAVACVEAVTVDASGTPNYPSKDRIPNYLKPYRPGLKQDTRHPTFSGVLWRRDAWRAVDWGKCAPFLYGDKDLWGQLSPSWLAVIAPSITVRHHVKVARSAAHTKPAPPARVPSVPLVPSVPSPPDPVSLFASQYYRSGVWKRRTTWRGRLVQKTPMDLWMYQQIIHETQPDIIIETGTLFGGSALYLANLCDLMDRGFIVTIDKRSVSNPKHPRIAYLTGSSTSPEIHEEVRARLFGRVMAILDSDHHRDHVLRELELFGPYITPGNYMIVEDCNLNGHPVRPDFGPGPWEAVQEYLPKHPEFSCDTAREQFFHTWNRGGYLKRLEVA